MKISDYITELQKIMDEHGPDIEVNRRYLGTRDKECYPEILYALKDLDDKYALPIFWEPWHDEDLKGEKVCKV